MTRLAQQGHNVLFVDPPINVGNVFFTQIKRGLWSISRVIKQYLITSEGAIVYTPLNVLPITSITSKLHARRIKSLAKTKLDPNIKTVLWAYHVQIPHIKTYIDTINHDLLVYDCVDNYTAFPENDAFYSAAANKHLTQKQEEYLSKKADLIFVSAPGLIKKLDRYNKNIFFTPNVGAFTKFNAVSNVFKSKNDAILPDDLKSIPRPRVGFTGALDGYKFDYDLMLYVAKNNPNVNFVLIGPMALKDTDADFSSLEIAKCKNVHYLGSRNYSSIQDYFAGFDAFMIPYVLNDYTVIGCFPVKFHDALAVGLPVVVTDMPAYYPFKDICFISKSNPEFSANIQNALQSQTVDSIEKRIQVASKNTWENKVSTMLDLIRKFLGNK
ncbi:MAG: glycosyltransferase [Patescibacteria group bacterium]|uniref:Glycosyltransferase n=1 Tax=candidate division WWE3 bacterium TaxID=2053526 RepID=A0A955EDJ8_UNCKA|nr:glycosyltransferase [candidate division WWE3 bacterium]